MSCLEARLIADRQDAEDKALDALGRYKFQMFGYWAAIWVHLNRLIGDAKPNPFTMLVLEARRKVEVQKREGAKP